MPTRQTTSPSSGDPAQFPRARLVCGDARGWRYGELPDEVEQRLPAWIASGCVAGGQLLKQPNVWRCGEWVVKFSAPSRGLVDRVRSSAALRAAELSRRLFPIRCARALAALTIRGGVRGDARRGSSVLVSEYVPGRRLDELIADDERAVAAFVSFLVEMHRRRIFHGDFHPGNSLWNGSQWVLLDLEGVRRGPQVWFPRRRIESQWARIHRKLLACDPSHEARVRALFERYAAQSGLWADSQAAWHRVLELAVEQAARYRERHGGRERPGKP